MAKQALTLAHPLLLALAPIIALYARNLILLTTGTVLIARLRHHATACCRALSTAAAFMLAMSFLQRRGASKLSPN